MQNLYISAKKSSLLKEKEEGNQRKNIERQV